MLDGLRNFVQWSDFSHTLWSKFEATPSKQSMQGLLWQPCHHSKTQKHWLPLFIPLQRLWFIPLFVFGGFSDRPWCPHAIFLHSTTASLIRVCTLKNVSFTASVKRMLKEVLNTCKIAYSLTIQLSHSLFHPARVSRTARVSRAGSLALLTSQTGCLPTGPISSTKPHYFPSPSKSCP